MVVPRVYGDGMTGAAPARPDLHANLRLCMSVVYPGVMAAIDELEDVRARLDGNAAERASLIRERDEIARRARDEGVTWRRIAAVLDMTEHGIIKSLKAR